MSTEPNLSYKLVDQDLNSIWIDYAPAYSKVFPMISFYAESVDMMVQSVRGYHNILDLGCGPGIITQKLAEEGHKVVGVDDELSMLDYAKKRLGKHPNVTFMKQDAHTLDIESETFDGIVCNNVLYYVRSPSQVLQESYRVLKFGGRMTLAGPRPDPDLDILFQIMIKDLDEKGVLTELSREIEVITACNRILAEKNMKNLYTNTGLENILISEIGFSRIVESRECYLSQSYFIVAQK